MKRCLAWMLLTWSVSGCQWLQDNRRPDIIVPAMTPLPRPVRAESITTANAYEQARLLEEELRREEAQGSED